MSTQKVYRVHKRIAVTVGGFFLLWLISGIVMVLPSRLYMPVPSQEPPPINFADLTVSPSQVVATLARILGSDPEVSSVSLKQIGDRVAYRIAVTPGGSYLIDARSGEVFTITPLVAEQIARDEYPSPARVLEVKHVDRYSVSYPWGPLPVYGVVFDDDRATISYVSPSDGAVRRTTRLSRIQTVISRLHTFEPLKLITRSEAVRTGLRLLLSALGIAVAVTGYYLSVPRRRASQKNLALDTAVPADLSSRTPAGFESNDEGATALVQRHK